MSSFLQRLEGLSPKRLTLLALEQQERLEELERDLLDPVVVVGVGCRIPGGVSSPDEYWSLLRDGRDAITEIPANRWDIEQFYDPDPEVPGRMATRWGGFVEEHDRFDAPFFSISRKEALSLDPQQRVLLETAWESLEHAGISPHSLGGSSTGVFVGLSTNDYHGLLLGRGQEEIDPYLATGTAHSIASGRISYILGLQGPNLAVDTACSSSLVAVHLACQSLRNRECDMALACGVNMMLSPEITIALSRSRMMAADGRCKAFDAAADGFVRSEGCGVIVLKRLSRAVADGDRLLAVIPGSAINQDGRSSGITAPNGAAQQAVIREALRRAAVAPADIQYVEAHGTGTSLGDPIEAHSLAAVLGRDRAAGDRLVVGSAKTNVGHLEAAAGIVGLIKVVLSLHHEGIPPHLHFKQMNPHIDWMGTPVDIPVRLQPWKRGSRRRLAGVSSFGFGGTNAHVILEEAPEVAKRPEGRERGTEVLTLSARTQPALERMAARLSGHLELHNDLPFGDVCFTANAGRADLAERAAWIVSEGASPAEALRAFQPFARGHAHAPATVAFLFSGQGTQYASMGRQLYESESVFRSALDECEGLLAEHLPVKLKDVLFGDAAALLGETAYTQPVLFSVQWSLAALWRSWGIEPSAVVGHSVGEYAAAAVAGVFSLEDAIRLIAGRGRLMSSVAGGDGAMAAILAPADRVAEAVERVGARVVIAAFNGPENVVISGAADDVERIEREFAEGGFRVERLRVNLAAHSPQMDGIATAFGGIAAELKCSAPRIPLISTVTGRVAGQAELADPGYWRRQLRQPVLFDRAMETLAGLSIGAFVEVGPGSTLLGMGRALIETEDTLWAPSIRRSRLEAEQMAETLAALYVRGVPVNWTAYHAGGHRRKVSLPTYPFEQQRYWPDMAPPSRKSVVAAMRGTLLGSRTDTALPTYRRMISQSSSDWIQDHRVGQSPLVPGSCFLEAALRAGSESLRTDSLDVSDFVLRNPLRLEPEISVETEAAAISESGNRCQFHYFSREAGTSKEGWREHAHAGISIAAESLEAEPLSAIRSRIVQPAAVTDFYDRLKGAGIDLQDRCRTLRSLWTGDGEVLAEFQSGIPVAALDGCFQALGAAVVFAETNATEEPPHVLESIGRLGVRGPILEHGFVHAVVTREDTGYSGELRVYDRNGRLAMKAAGLRLLPVTSESRATPSDWFYQLQWKPTGPTGASRAGLAVAEREAIDRLAGSLAETTGLRQYEKLRPRLDALVSGFAVRALEGLGIVFEPGAIVVPEEIAARTGILDRHRRLFDRLLAMLGEDGILDATETGWRVGKAPAMGDLDEESRSLQEEFAEYAAESELTVRCAGRLADVLRGLADPLELLTGGGDYAKLERLYTDSAAARTFNQAAAEAVREAVRLSGDRPLRVVEIGAGTGGTSTAILPVLRGRCSEYVYSDISPAFLARAAERFREYPFLRTAAFDVERRNDEQGLPEGHFDLVIAANVLHATEDIRVAVANAGRLARPGGLLLFIEGTRAERWVDVTFGMTDGWWKFNDDLRSGSPLLGVQAWTELLRSIGASEVAAVQPAGSQQVLLLGRRASDGTTAAKVLLSGSSAEERDVQEQLRLLGIPAELAEPASLAEIVRDGETRHVVLMSPDGEELCRRVAQALPAILSGAEPRPKLWVVTRNAQCLSEDTEILPEQALLWGLGRTASLEHPDVWGGLIDLESGVPAETIAAAIASEIGADDGEDQVAYRQGVRYAPRIARMAAPASSLPRIDAEGVYVVSGGIGNLGLAVADWLVARGARHLVLASRRTMVEGTPAFESVRLLRARGAEVTTVSADVSSQEGIDAIRRAMGPRKLRGIVHTAAKFDSAPLAGLPEDSLRAVLRPKVEGSLRLAALAEEGPLDFLVLFSSSTALLGVSGMGAYAAANQYMDALAHRLRMRGCPAVSINWGTWNRMGDLAAEIRESYARTGLKPMATPLALEGMGRAIGAGIAQMCIADIDWSALRPVYEARRRRPVLEEVANIATAPAAPQGAASEEFAASLERVPQEDRMQVLTDRVREDAAGILGLNPDEVDASLGLFEMGMDSLMTVDLKRRLERSFGLPLPSTLTFNYPNVTALAQFLAGKLGIGDEPAVAAAPAVGESPERGDSEPDSLEELSEDELAELLARALEDER